MNRFMTQTRIARTRHFSNALPNTTSHPHYSNLTKRILVEPFRNEFARVLQSQVETRRSHVAVRHRCRQVENEDEVADDGSPYCGSRRKQADG